MPLKGKKPKAGKPRLKTLLFGPAGVGKTTAAIKMPKPYVIDTENGTAHYGDTIEASGGAVFSPTDMHELIREVQSLMSEEHEYLTLVIDPITTIYHQLGDEGERAVGTDFQKHYKQYADKFVRRLVNLLQTIDMNVIVTAHEKNQWGKDAKGDPTIIGTTFDGYAKLDYMFDLCLHLRKEDKDRIATVTKTRLAEFPDGDEFPWSYEELSKRIGTKHMEATVDTVELANDEQVSRFNYLLSQVSDAEQKKLGIDRALKGVEDIADLPAERIATGIQVLESHLSA